MDALVLNPPDGWTGFPKLPDVIRQIAANRDAAAMNAKAANIERAPDPVCERCEGTGWRQTLQANRVAKCHCWAPRPKLEQKPALMPAEQERLTLRDVLAKAAPGATVEQVAKPMPEEPVSAVLLSPELAEKRREQMLRELERKEKA